MKTLAWIGTITSVLGALGLAFKFAVFGYTLFIVGSSAWFYIGLKRKDSALWSLNFIFLIIDFVGAYNYAI